MRTSSRLALSLGALALLAVYFFPLWRIDLHAPQYPEGLGLRIWVNQITGVKPNDLNSINGLNHYIGMHEISPDDIPELRLMPWILGGLVAFGVVTAVVGRRGPLYAWLTLLVFGAVGGLMDFWMWGYRYGHELDEHAAIKVPGMSYQPPVIGTKQLLNFEAAAWPEPGAWIALAVFLIGIWVLLRERRRSSTTRGVVASVAAAVALLTAVPPAAQGQQLVVRPGSAIPTLTAAVQRAGQGDTILVLPGTYREPRIEIKVPVTIVGRGNPVFDGGGAHEILTVKADQVTVRGLTLRNVGHSYTEDRAAIRLDGVRDCIIDGNRLVDTYFGVYAARSSGCVIANNVIEGRAAAQTTSGNAIHLFYSTGFTVVGNRIRAHRDGIYLEFAQRTRILGNESRENLRYGLHFMYSDSCDYRDNRFVNNGAGVAVMYSRAVTMVGNRFQDNWGSAAYGLLLKEIKDSRVEGNTLSRNTVGIYAEGSDRIVVAGNQFLRNGWAVRLMADATGNSFRRNRFEGNSFDVATNSIESSPSSFTENYWDGYTGYDLDRDGYGDVPYRPVRLFSILAEESEPALILLRSLFLELLDVAERVVPVITPERLVDPKPLMRWSAL